MARAIVFIDYDVLLCDVLKLPEDTRIIGTLDSERAQGMRCIEIVIEHDSLFDHGRSVALTRFCAGDEHLRAWADGKGAVLEYCSERMPPNDNA